MTATSARILGAAILVALAFTVPWPGGSSSGAGYTGTLPNVRVAVENQMAAADRPVLADALETAGEMLEADKLGLVGTTEELQRFVQAALEFSYLGLGKPTEKYPAVAKTIQAAIEIAIGEDVVPVTPALRSKVAAVLAEAGKAVR